ncbi:MAG: hypothetical protein Q9160_008832 [Pyrenula sp. 1 TL-2023]
MARIKKKGTSGQAKNYITRTQAVRKLQISLPDFRRLCIFKGIYPREPRDKKKASKSSTPSTTFYYTKDIQYLLHEPLLQKFRDQKTLSKKIARSLGRNEVGDAVRLEKHHTPRISLDHIIRERYPTFVDALRELDDALSLLFLFASLPSTTTVPTKVVSRCQRLCHEFEHYLITSHSLQKSFLSIKGIYYQATIQGQDIRWLVPYRFVQRVSGDIDFRVMGTFVEFYATLLGFVNFRLYTSIGLVYPPKFDASSDGRGAELAAFKLEGRKIGNSTEDDDQPRAITNGYAQTDNTIEMQERVETAAAAQEAEQALDAVEQTPDITKSEDVPEPTDAIDTFEPVAPSADILPQPSASDNEAASLFRDCTFFISREAPRHSIEFLLRAFGCRRVGWDEVLGEGAFTHNETDQRITHQVVDRPETPFLSDSTADGAVGKKAQAALALQRRVPGRTYVQPQWVWDSVNELKLQRPDLYAPGATLPPHLSPWVKSTQGQYDPRATLAEQEEEGEAELGDGNGAQESEEEQTEAADQIDDQGSEDEEDDILDNGMDVASSDSEASSAESSVPEATEDFGGFSDSDAASTTSHSSIDSASQYQRELEAEAAGIPVSGAGTTKSSKKGGGQKPVISEAQKQRQRKKREADEEIERRKMMMSRKKRKLYEKMAYGNEKRDKEAEKLRGKRRRIEREKGPRT